MTLFSTVEAGFGFLGPSVPEVTVFSIAVLTAGGLGTVKNIIIMTTDNSRDQLVNGTLDILRSVTCKK